MAFLPYVLLLTHLLLFFSQFCSAAEVITQSQPLPDDGRTTLVSKDGSFELGFFTPGSSTNRYVGIWYKNIPGRTVVWVANRDIPIEENSTSNSTSNSSMLSINTEGHLVLLNQNKTVVWLANSTTKASSPIVELLDSGNLVLRDERDQNPQNYLWQSFDYPSDTFFPGMKIGWDLKTDRNRRITAWKNWDDPTPADFTWEIVLHNYIDVIFKLGQTVYFRSGPWNGIRFSDSLEFIKYTIFFNYQFVFNKDEIYEIYHPLNKSTISRFVLNKTTYSREGLMWIEEAQSWTSFSVLPKDNCDKYNPCGPYGNCDTNKTPECQCLSGFKPKSPQNWDMMDWSQGCERSEPWSCKVKNGDGFVKFSGLKLPDTTHSWVDANMTLEECRAKCLENCSCTAYANSNINGGGSGCAIWFGELNDIRQIPIADQDLYIRLVPPKTEDADRNKIKEIVIPSTILLTLAMVFTLLYIYRIRRKSREKPLLRENGDEGSEGDMELPFYDLAVIASSTNNFSTDKKLGEGGFGPVYKGTLANGQEIAVKRLSKSSRQGMKEFKNEVALCAKLQHRNLVKVIGCCIQEEEKMLIYEYMPNKSLDSFIFGSITQGKLLNWHKRFQIIRGIARGLLYLHQDSRLRVIHRDLKASNVLLDSELNPKISDFGLARMFGGDQVEDNTSRVVGTYGYMAPEYAIDGLFSIKSDVFSFGILLLEIVSGLKNKGISYPTESLNLIGHAWRLWKDDIPLKLIDGRLRDSYIASEVLHCIHIGLLCVQHHPHDRPSMASVNVMLSSDCALPQPKEPAFLLQKSSVTGESSSDNHMTSSNKISITQLEAR